MKRISSLMSRKSSKSSIEKISNNSTEKEQVKPVTIPIRILGSRGCGKTSFLYKSYFKYGTDQPDTKFNVIPTPTYNVEMIPYQSHLFEVWDFAEMSFCLNHIGENTKIILYMIDSIEYQKETVSSKTRDNMIWLLENFNQALQDTIIITIANKQQELEAIDIQDIGQSWVDNKKLIGLLKGHDWRIFSCNSITGKGMNQIFEYLDIKLKERRKRKRSSIISLPPSPPSTFISKRTTLDEQQDEVTPWDNVPNPYHLTDQEFQQWFYTGKSFLFFNYECLIRIIYLTLLIPHNSRQQFALLHYHLKTNNNNNYTSLRSSSSSISTSLQYSETQTLFWIQMISFALLKCPVLDGQDNTFQDFFTRCQLQEDCWKDYYSYKTFYSQRASKEFLPPDKKSLPNAFKSSSLALKGAGLRIDYQVL